MTARLSPVTSKTVRLPAGPRSAAKAAGPVTKALTPCGA
ncbi:Uncharacterised protein [Mycobacteroides abscessus subsp. abscessus]|nr:Uncharacterised protein [Mycobacteroides abscessus subsp. abscessus]